MSFDRSKINKLRYEIIKNAAEHKRPDLFISDHVAERILDRHMARDLPFITGICKNFYDNHFTKTTYTSRKYKVGFRGLYVCFNVCVGAVSGRRMAVLTTTFEGDQDYYCDETIILK